MMQMNDERKRMFESGDGGQQKRFRPEDILGTTHNREDGNRVITRLLVNRQQFSKLIGRGGQMITHIRNTSNVTLKGNDLNEEERLVLIVGQLQQVLKAFDMVTELLLEHAAANSGGMSMQQQQMILFQQQQLMAAGADPSSAAAMAAGGTIFSVNIMLEHQKAGRAVGTGGSMIQNLKLKSGAQQLRISKDPIDVCGVSLRKLTIDGNITAIRRAHYLVVELFHETSGAPQQQQLGGYSNALTMSSVSQSLPTAGNMNHYQQSPQQQQQQQRMQQQGNYGQEMQQFAFPGGAASGLRAAAAAAAAGALVVKSTADGSNAIDGSELLPGPLEFSALLDYNVQAETVRQLTEMKNYLQKHFGLDLTIFKDGVLDKYARFAANLQQQQRFTGAPAAPDLPTAPALTAEQILAAKKATSPNDLCFFIPKACAGAIIGKGGQNLKDLMAAFRIRIYVDRDEVENLRLVILSPPHDEQEPTTAATAAAASTAAAMTGVEGGADVVADGGTLIGKRSGVETAAGEEDADRGKRNKPSEDVDTTTAAAGSNDSISNSGNNSMKRVRGEEADDAVEGDSIPTKMGKIGADSDSAEAAVTTAVSTAMVLADTAAATTAAVVAGVGADAQARMMRCKQRIEEMVEDQLLERAPAGSIVAIPTNA